MSFQIKCPECGCAVEVEADELPERSSDDTDVECDACEHIIELGWYAEIEYR